MKKLALVSLGLVLSLAGSSAMAKSASIGYELLTENSDAKAKTYTITFAVWSTDKDANQLKVSAVADADNPGLEVLSKPLSWKNVKKGQHKEATVSVRNSSGETRNLTLKVQRLAGGSTVSKDETKTEHFDDTKEVSVMVPAP